MLDDYHNSDIIKRVFRKPRGDRVIDYEYTARADMFNHDNQLFGYMIDTFQNGTIYKDYGCSNCKELLGLEFKQRRSPVIDICREAGHRGRGNKMHDTVQDHFLKNDKYTLCYELPVYSDEHNRSGFIDLVRYDPVNDIYWILDFKPNAHKERYQKVLSQLFWYKLMLNERTSIPLDKIKCAYFDDLNYYELV